MTWKTWFLTLLQAMLSGAAAAALVVQLIPGQINYKVLGTLFLGGAVLGLLNHLKQSPLPGIAKEAPIDPAK